MKYNPPFGSGDPDAPYVDRNTPNAQSGSKVPASAIEDPQREIVKVIVEAGLTPNPEDTTQLWQALQILLDGVRTELPVYPNCLGAGGTFGVMSPSTGNVRVPAGTAFVIRGSRRYTTEQVNLPTLSSRVYHLRWNKTDGFKLYNVGSMDYNPGGADEDSAGFDSSFDDMLVARVTTNGGNVPTVTNLKNKPKLDANSIRRDYLPQALSWTTLAGSGVALNWARKPDVSQVNLKGFRSNVADADGTPWGPGFGKILNVEVRIPNGGASRYGIENLEYFYEDDAGNFGWIASNIINIAY